VAPLQRLSGSAGCTSPNKSAKDLCRNRKRAASRRPGPSKNSTPALSSVCFPHVLNCRVNRQSRRFLSRCCMNFANAIRPKMNRHSTTNSTMLFVGVGRFSGNLAVGSICRKHIRCALLVAWNEAAISGQATHAARRQFEFGFCVECLFSQSFIRARACNSAFSRDPNTTLPFISSPVG
jgi:hypothetical protein